MKLSILLGSALLTFVWSCSAATKSTFRGSTKSADDSEQILDEQEPVDSSPPPTTTPEPDRSASESELAFSLSLTINALDIVETKLEANRSEISEESSITLRSKETPSTQTYSGPENSGLGGKRFGQGFIQSFNGLKMPVKFMKLNSSKMDLLFVIDNTASTYDERKRLEKNAADIISALSAQDWRIAFTTAKFSTNCIDFFVEKNDPLALSKIESGLNPPTTPDDDERQLLNAAKGAELSCGWRRVGAPLGVLIFTDEDNRGIGVSSLSNPDEKYYSSTQSSIQQSSGSFEGLISWRSNDGAAACPTAVSKATRLSHLLSINGNAKYYSICEPNYKPALDSFISEVAKLRTPRAVSYEVGSIDSYSILGVPGTHNDIGVVSGRIDLSSANSIPDGSIVDIIYVAKDTRGITESITVPPGNLVEFSGGFFPYNGTHRTIRPDDYVHDTATGTITLNSSLKEPGSRGSFSWREYAPSKVAMLVPLIIPGTIKNCQLATYDSAGKQSWAPFTQNYTYERLTGKVSFDTEVPGSSWFRCDVVTGDDPILVYSASISKEATTVPTVVDAATGEVLTATFDNQSETVRLQEIDVYNGRVVKISYKARLQNLSNFILGQGVIPSTVEIVKDGTTACPLLSLGNTFIDGTVTLGPDCSTYNTVKIMFKKVQAEIREIKFTREQLDLFYSIYTANKDKWTVKINQQEVPDTLWSVTEDGLGVRYNGPIEIPEALLKLPVITLTISVL